MNMNKNFPPKMFLLLLIIAVVYFCYIIFKPFLIEIIAAVILTSTFYSPYKWFCKKFHGRKNLAALVMCILLFLIIILPLANLVIFGAQKITVAYSGTVDLIERSNLDDLIKNNIFEKAKLLGINVESLKNSLFDLSNKFSGFLFKVATTIIQSTTNFFISLILVIFTMFFFFVKGEDIAKKIMYLTPLSNKYDIELFSKFRDVSHSIMISTFIVAIVQGLLGAAGFAIVGLPSFLPGIFIAIFSLIPAIGTGLIWFPVAVYLLIIGEIWQGIFLLTWGILIVSMIDNVIRAYIVKDKAEVHPIIIILSILGGISVFGFWGIVLGPLIVSLTITVMRIYELEYKEVLEK